MARTTIRRWTAVALLGGLWLAGGASPAHARQSPPIGVSPTPTPVPSPTPLPDPTPAPTPLPAPTPIAPALSGVFRLDLDASYQRGCFDPCDCPLVSSTHFRGTMRLTPAAATIAPPPTRLPGPLAPTPTNPDGPRDLPPIGVTPTPAPAPTPTPLPTPNRGRTYRVTDVNWLVSIAGTEIYLTGEGTYDIVPANAPASGLRHRLRLALKSADGAALQNFDSGFQPLAAITTPGRIDITISLNGLVCADTAIRVKATNLPSSAIRPYGIDAASTYNEGCFAPCTCPLRTLPLSGKFGLVVLPGQPILTPVIPGPPAEWAFVDLGTISPLSNTSSASLVHRGVGIFQQQRFISPLGTTPTPSVRQRLRANLVRTNAPTPAPGAPAVKTRFDSNWVAASARFPDIKVSIADNAFQCFNRVFNLSAKPRP